MTGSGPRPVNLKTDLAPLADLIEIAFADTMDSGGRAAIREMRALSRLGPGLSIVPAMNELVLGVGMGYVWIEDGRLVGNVSVYPASQPPEAPRAWIIANVAVHPDYRGRGIARSLMQDSLASVRERSATPADVILQVEAPNWKARQLYESLGFSNEGAFTLWRRGPSRVPDTLQGRMGPYIARRSWNEWRAEYALAERARPPELGGIGWLRPVAPSLFRPSLRKAINDFVNLRGKERLVIQDAHGAMTGALWIERGFGAGAVQLTLLVDPEAREAEDMALLLTGLRRFGPDHTLAIEHPAEDTTVCALLERFDFRRVRTLVHMRWRP
jgi:ribosomal protein S18 acetylase RimI-like enzyme